MLVDRTEELFHNKSRFRSDVSFRIDFQKHVESFPCRADCKKMV